MIEMELENERVERLRVQRMGEDWIKAIADGAPGRLEAFCGPELMSHVLTPKRSLTLENASALVAKYQGWFGTCTDIRVEESRICRVGERLGIFYRFYLQDQGNWYSIEQQLYCTVKDGRVQQLHLLCSGFHSVGTVN